MNLNQIVWLDFDYMNKHYEGEAIPALTQTNSMLPAFDIYFNNEYSGTLLKNENQWTANSYIENGMVKIIGNKLLSFFKD
jgi:hypothetical protein